MKTEPQKTNKRNFLTSGGERFSYGLYFFGQNIFFIFLYLYLSVYLTDVGIPALTVSAIALAVKVWDAVNDPLFGGIVDAVKLKKGKFLPWLRISLIAIPIATILFFAIPSGVPLIVKIIWSVAAYVLWDTAYTICDVPIFGLVTVMTDNQNERTTLMAIGRVTAMIATVIVYMGVPSVRAAIGGWLPTTIVLASSAPPFGVYSEFRIESNFAAVFPCLTTVFLPISHFASKSITENSIFVIAII